MHTHTHLTGLPEWAGTRKVIPIWILLKQETVSGSGISWAICKSAHRSRETTTPAPNSSVFYRPDALPAAQPTVSKHWWHIALKAYCSTICCNNNKKATTNGWTINDTLNHPLLQCVLWNEIIFPIVVRGKFLFWSIQMRSSSSFHLQSTAG